MNFFRPPVIVGTLPNTIANGQTADATPVMADLNWIVNQVNANAAALSNTALLNAANSFTLPQAGVSATAIAQFPIVADIITGGYQTLTSSLGTNTIAARSTQIIPSSLVANQSVFLIPSQTNTGAATLNRDSLGSSAILQEGLALSGGELQRSVPVRLFFDGSNYHVIGPFSGGRVLGNLIFSGNLQVNGTGNIAGTMNLASLLLLSSSPDSITTSSPVLGALVNFAIANFAGTVTYDITSGASTNGRLLFVKNYLAQLLNSSASNVVPMAGGAAGTAILAATIGAWALLRSNGSNWEIMARG